MLAPPLHGARISGALAAIYHVGTAAMLAELPLQKACVDRTPPSPSSRERSISRAGMACRPPRPWRVLDAAPIAVLNLHVPAWHGLCCRRGSC